MQDLTTKELDAIVRKHIDGIISDVQEKLGIKYGDVAGQYFSGSMSEELAAIKTHLTIMMIGYITTEKMYSEAP